MILSNLRVKDFLKSKKKLHVFKKDEVPEYIKDDFSDVSYISDALITSDDSLVSVLNLYGCYEQKTVHDIIKLIQSFNESLSDSETRKLLRSSERSPNLFMALCYILFQEYCSKQVKDIYSTFDIFKIVKGDPECCRMLIELLPHNFKKYKHIYDAVFECPYTTVKLELFENVDIPDECVNKIVNILDSDYCDTEFMFSCNRIFKTANKSIPVLERKICELPSMVDFLLTEVQLNFIPTPELELLYKTRSKYSIRNYAMTYSGITGMRCLEYEDYIFSGNVDVWTPNDLLRYIQNLDESCIDDQFTENVKHCLLNVGKNKYKHNDFGMQHHIALVLSDMVRCCKKMSDIVLSYMDATKHIPRSDEIHMPLRGIR